MKEVSADPNILIIGGSTCNDGIAVEIAGILGTDLFPCDIGKFANGEPDIDLKKSVRGKTVFFIQRSLTGNGEMGSGMMETRTVADALLRAKVGRMILIQLNFPMSRQDRREFNVKSKSLKPKRRPISARVAADFYTECGFEDVVTIHLHSAQIEGFFDARKCGIDNINPASVFIDYLHEEGILNGENSDLMLVSPDVGGATFVSLISDILNLPPYAIIDKRRTGPGKSKAMNIIGSVKGKRCILWDDMVDSGGTAVEAAEKVLDEGAKEVMLIATHPVLTGEAVKNLLNSKFSKAIFTNTLPIPVELKNSPKIVQLSIGPMVARIIANIYNDESLEEIVNINTEFLQSKTATQS